MELSDQSHPDVESEEQRFLRKALATVDKAERVQRIKRIVVTAIAFAAAFALAFRRPGPELNLECTIFIGVGLIAAVCTAQLKLLINSSTKNVLNAIASLHQDR